PGELTTRPVKFSGKHLFVNSVGEMSVVVRDESGTVLATSRPHAGDATKHRIEWVGIADLSAFTGKPIRFSFSLGSGSLYSFWVAPDEAGASNGYVGAGGPAFNGVRDTTH
ncbi:MAG: hypothetical protein IT576_04615, partial [Verrucomicrobiales bacterium]|nr:hypothetical protein [Verrucomicrobiales bacterium]